MKKPFFHPGHKPVTRRDFLSQGFIQSSSMIMAPSILGMLLRSSAAHADNCDSATTGTMPAVLIFDHAGGAALLAQTLPLSFGDQPLSASGYAALGMTAAQAPTGSIGSVIDSSWGINFHKNLSFLQTLNSTALPAAKALTNSFNTVASLSDDTSNNTTNPAAGLAMLGAIGDSDRKLAAVIGTSATASGGNSASSVASPLFNSTVIQSATAAANLVSTGQLAVRLGNNKDLAAKVIAAMQKMSHGQLARFSAQDLPTQASQLIQCGYLKASAMTGTPQPGIPGLDPKLNASTTATFDFTNSLEQQVGTLTYLLAMGFSGVATVTLGGRDYHDSTRQTGETADAEAAKLTAKALNLFHTLVTGAQGARARPLMIIHITDGGLNAGGTEDATVAGFFPWTSDRGTANGAYVMMYDPAGRPKVARNQLGYSTTSDGGVDTKNVTTFSSNATALSEVFMINYLQLAGQSPGSIAQVFPSMVLSTADIAKYAITAKGGS